MNFYIALRLQLKQILMIRMEKIELLCEELDGGTVLAYVKLVLWEWP